MEENIMLWDVGAGSAIVKAAGGEIQIDNSNDLFAPVKVIAKSQKVCPKWHAGAGGKTWLFADEIIIE